MGKPLDNVRVDELFAAALDLPPEERSAFLDRACAKETDPNVRRAVEELLRLSAEDDIGNDLAQLQRGELLQELARAGPNESALGGDGLTMGSRIGAYRVAGEIGRGGMGVVYLGERVEGDFEQRVAIKVLQTGLGGESMVRRFEEERNILASLAHPYVARLYGGGATSDGRPYFTMEHVEGIPINRYCDEHRLTVDERLELFSKVVQAVHYAHRNLVIHRDIKPSNILVGPDGEPKLLDFGIAKLESAKEVSAATTRRLDRRLTPEYASPELLRGEAVTTSSDVYQLGLVLYELLTGSAAHQAPKSECLNDWEEVVCRTDPQTPSAAVDRTDLDRDGGPASRTLARTLRGDLDTIVLKALQKEPELRYSSAEQLAQDIHRFRTKQPVLARPPTPSYRARRFVARNRGGVAAGLAVLLSLIAGFAGMYWQATVAKAERDRARIEAATAKQVTEFLIDLFAVADPSESKGQTVTAEQLLARGAQQVDRQLADEPVVRARLLDALGRVHHALGLHAKARPLLEEGLRIRRDTLGPRHTEVADSLYSLATLLCETENCAAADPLYREALSIRRKVAGPEDPDSGWILLGLGRSAYEQGDFENAESLLREALAIQRASPGADRQILADSLGTLAVVLHAQGNLAEAEPLYRRAFEIQHEEFGDDHPKSLGTLGNLASLLQTRGQRSAAEPLLRRALAGKRKVFGSQHERVASAADNLGLLLAELGQFEEAEALTREALAIRIALRGDEAPSLAMPWVNAGFVSHKKGDLVAAESSYARAVALASKGKPGHPQLGVSSFWYGKLLAELGREAEAEPNLRTALKIYRQVYGEGDDWSLDAQIALGSVLSTLAKTEEAESLLLSAKSAAGNASEQHRAALEALSRHYERTGRAQDALEHRRLLEELAGTSPETDAP